MEWFMRSKIKIVFFLLVLMSCNYDGYTQTDSLSSGADSVQSPEYGPDNSQVDTSMAQVAINDKDTILKWKGAREFTYMKYLDSLLKNRSDLRTDTVSVDGSTGKINRSRGPSEDISAINLFLNSTPVRLFFWLLALIFIGFIVYNILFKKEIFRKKRSIIPDEEADETLHELNDISEYDGLISDAENKKEYDLAVRYWYLKTLRNLSDRGFINFAPDKTNKEYVTEMNRNHYSNEFERLTRNYEYIWYGRFSIEEERYRLLKESFNLFNKKV
ncbi:MAG: DUF4129 domain-containing protein [Ginsengibacter sp.]